MIEHFIQKHIQDINESFKNLDINQINLLEDLIVKNKGRVFFTGVGKNGHVMAKASSTFNSMGIPTDFINPVDAVHGDLGKIKSDDLIIALSKSGNTDELINFLSKVLKKTKNTFLIHSNEKNESLNFVKNSLYIPVNGESDHLNVIPTSSIVIYTIIMQSISCNIANKNKLQISDFVINHPGGTLGKLI